MSTKSCEEEGDKLIIAHETSQIANCFLAIGITSVLVAYALALLSIKNALVAHVMVGRNEGILGRQKITLTALTVLFLALCICVFGFPFF